MKRLTKICGLTKLNVLKYAHQRHMKCYPRTVGRMVKSAEGKVTLTHELVFCCGKRLGRHRRSGGRRKARSYDWRRAYRSHASHRRRSR